MAQYKKERYKEVRVFHEKTEVWFKSYKMYLEKRDYKDPTRGARMALDVVNPYEKFKGESVTFKDLLDASYTRDMLIHFKKDTKTMASTKIKYIKMFENIIKFLLTDIESLELKKNECNEEIIAREIKMKTILNETETVLCNLSKHRGKDLVKTKEKTEKIN